MTFDVILHLMKNIHRILIKIGSKMNVIEAKILEIQSFTVSQFL